MRASRSIKQVKGEARQKVVDTAYRGIRARTAGVSAYADKKNTNEMICDSWSDAWDEVEDDGVVLEGLDRGMTKGEVALV